MKTLAIAVATAMFALTAPVEASGPAPAESTVGQACPAGFELYSSIRVIVPPPGTIVVGPGDVDGDGYLCRLVLAKVWIQIDNKL
jgi:hypothetical protein